MFTIEWLASNGAVVDSDVTSAEDVALAHGKALGRAIYQARKHATPPDSYRILDASGHQVAAARLPTNLRSVRWVAAPADSP